MIVFAKDANIDSLLELMFKRRHTTIPRAIVSDYEAVIWLGNDAIVATPSSESWVREFSSAEGRKVGSLIDFVVQRRQTIFKEGGRHERLDEAGIGQGNVLDP